MNNQAIYDKVNARILAELDNGVLAWRKPWNVRKPINLVSGKPYKGVNLWLLPTEKFEDHRYVTFKQAKELGGSIRKGESGHFIVFWQMIKPKGLELPKDADDESVKVVPMLKYYYVWNVSQVDGLTLPPVGNENEVLAEPQSIIDNMPKRPIILRSDSAAYSPIKDVVFMPSIRDCHSSADWFQIAYHELAHSTGHPSRLGRFDLSEPLAHFGTESYAREELVAELTSAYLCAHVGIVPSMPTNAAAYIDGWRKAIKDDPRAVVVAAGKAQRAADYILGDSDTADCAE